MRNVIFLRYGEIFLKGKNRKFFEKALIENIKKALSGFVYNFKVISGRYLISDYSFNDEKNIVDRVKNVFGLVSLSLATEIETGVEEIKNYCSKLIVEEKTFRISVTRADKTFPIKSNEFEPVLGECVLNNNPSLNVDLHKPEKEVIVEIRENKKTYILYEKIDCVMGMPVGTAGEGLLLLSGGIDSPVAGYMMLKRGLKLSAIHFHSFPYTSELAKDKVKKLAEILKKYSFDMRLFMVPFTMIQEEIHKSCKSEYMITIMRRIMMRIAERICEKYKLKAIITGESLAQVASQTVEGITSSNCVVKNIPILRPLIAFDKIETIRIAEKIGTFETSILPYEDCCTVFLPKNPLIKPVLSLVEAEEAKLDINFLIENAIKNLEILN